MAFVRTKVIKGHRYYYLCVTAPGRKQKVVAYLGRQRPSELQVYILKRLADDAVRGGGGVRPEGLLPDGMAIIRERVLASIGRGPWPPDELWEAVQKQERRYEAAARRLVKRGVAVEAARRTFALRRAVPLTSAGTTCL